MPLRLPFLASKEFFLAALEYVSAESVGLRFSLSFFRLSFASSTSLLAARTYNNSAFAAFTLLGQPQVIC